MPNLRTKSQASPGTPLPAHCSGYFSEAFGPNSSSTAPVIRQCFAARLLPAAVTASLRGPGMDTPPGLRVGNVRCPGKASRSALTSGRIRSRRGHCFPSVLPPVLLRKRFSIPGGSLGPMPGCLPVRMLRAWFQRKGRSSKQRALQIGRHEVASGRFVKWLK